MLEEVNQESTPETIVEKVNLTPETKSIAEKAVSTSSTDNSLTIETKPTIEKTTSEFSFSSLIKESTIPENKEKLSPYEINKKNLKQLFSCTEYR
jgi:hypothetical protein